jgi:peptidoglycan/LPS O-acetylase OafA/YrhL
VEEQFYLIWPILVFFLPRASLPWLLFSALVGCPALRWAALERGVGDKLLYTASQYRLDSIAAGSLLAFLQPVLMRQRLLPLRTLGAAVFTVSVPALFWLWLHSSRNLGNSSIYVFLALASGSAVSIALVSADTRIGTILASGPLRYFGKIGYGLYLIHPFVFSGVSKRMPNISGLTTAVLLSFLLAAASWHFMERRVLECRALFLGPTPGLAQSRQGRV